MKVIKKVFNLVFLYKRNEFLFLLFFVFLSAIFNLIGIVTIFPFISLIIDPQLLETHNLFILINKLFGFFGLKNSKDIIFILGIFLLFSIIISTCLLAITSYLQIHFSFQCEKIFSYLLVKNYCGRSYKWFLHQNTSELIKNTLADVNQVINDLIYPLVAIFSNILSVLIIFLIFFLVNIKVSIIVIFVFSLIYITIFYIIKKSLLYSGEISLNANKSRFKILSEIFAGIKEIKIRGLENFYLKRLAKPFEIFATSKSFYGLLGVVPRYLIELIIFSGAVIFLLFTIKFEINFVDNLPFLILFLFATYRLIPSLQQIYKASVQVRFSSKIFNSLYKKLIVKKEIIQEKKKLSLKIKKSILIKNVSYSFNGIKKNLVLKKINIIIPAFTTVGIFGNSGSGKTTLLDIIAGLIEPTSGSIVIDGNILNNYNKSLWKNSVGYVSQNIFLTNSSIASNIAFGLDKKDFDYDNLKRVIKISGISNLIKKLPNGYNTIIREKGSNLSGGERQRIALARALYFNPTLLIMDEATNAQHKSSENIIVNNILNLKKKMTIIIISHNPEIIKKCDTIFIMKKGKLKKKFRL
jgi:ABC-type bacteriocin/lantibiotic exporter with double-glycine peptidase domain